MSDSQPERLRGREEVERISELLRRFIEHLCSHDRSEQTIKSYSSDLKLFAKWFSETNSEELTPQSITPIDLREHKRYLLEDRGFKPATVNRRVASISAFCKWAQEEGIADGNPCDEIGIVPEVRATPKWLTKRAQYALIRAVQKANRPRDEALIMLMLHTGLRVGEVSTLHIGDVSISPGGTDTYPQMQLCVLWSLSLHEGRRERPVLALPKTREPKTRHGTRPLPSSRGKGLVLLARSYGKQAILNPTGSSSLAKFPGTAIPIFGSSPTGAGGSGEAGRGIGEENLRLSGYKRGGLPPSPEGAVPTGDGVLTAKSLVNVATVTSLSPGKLPPSFIPSHVLQLFRKQEYVTRE